MVKRTRSLFTIKSKLQFKYAVVLLFCMLVPSVFIGICMYYFMFMIVSQGMGARGPIAYNLFPLLQKVNLIMSGGLFFILIVFLMIGVYISQKLIGPVERIKKDLKQIADGDMNHRIRMRKSDDFAFIAESVNKILDRK